MLGKSIGSKIVALHSETCKREMETRQGTEKLIERWV